MCLEPDSLSSALACPLDLGARPTCRGLRAPLYANYQGLPQGELCPREGKRPRLRSQAVPSLVPAEASPKRGRQAPPPAPSISPECVLTLEGLDPRANLCTHVARGYCCYLLEDQ